MVSKQEFENAYREYSPSKIEAFYIKNISVAGLSRKIVPSIFISVGLMIPFILALFCKILHFPHFIMIVSSIVYIYILAMIGVFYGVLVIKRKRRIANICKKLRISKKRYDQLVHKYYYENYYPDIKDYINHIIDSSTHNLHKNK